MTRDSTSPLQPSTARARISVWERLIDDEARTLAPPLEVTVQIYHTRDACGGYDAKLERARNA